MPASAAASLIIERVDALGEFLPAAAKGDVTSVHKARVATRRLRAALPIAASRRKIAPLARSIRRVTDALGPVRELDVALMILKEVEEDGGVSRAAAHRLRTAIGDERRQLRAVLNDRLEKVDFDKLRKRMIAAARNGDESTPRIRDPKRAASAHEEAVRRARRLDRALERAAALYVPDRLHEVRIAVKKLRYTIELEQRFRGSRAKTRIRTLKAAQDLLGRMHDLEVLITKTRAVQASGASSLEISGDLDTLVRRLESECRQLHGRYMTARKGLLLICQNLTTRPVRSSSRSSAA